MSRIIKKICFLLISGSLWRWDICQKRFCMNFLGEHPGTFLGSDCHNMTDRPPNVEAARKFIAEYFGDKALAYMDEVAEKILTI